MGLHAYRRPVGLPLTVGEGAYLDPTMRIGNPMYWLRPNRENDVALFYTHHFLSGDIDPNYPALYEVGRLLNLNTEAFLWLTQMLVTFNQLTSAVEAFLRHPQPEPFDMDTARLPTATERRGLRGGYAMQRYIQSYLDIVTCGGVQTQEAFITQGWLSSPQHNYLNMWEKALSIPQNGRWAAFKWTELLKKVCGFNLTAPDMRLDFSSGPKEGMLWMWQGQHKFASPRTQWFIVYSNMLRDVMYTKKGVPLPDWEGLETNVCDFNSMLKGRYYEGHDIDEQWEQAQDTLKRGLLSQEGYDLIMQARQNVFPQAYLGEAQPFGEGWGGIDRKRNTHYALTGEIVLRRHEPAFQWAA